MFLPFINPQVSKVFLGPPTHPVEQVILIVHLSLLQLHLSLIECFKGNKTLYNSFIAIMNISIYSPYCTNFKET